MRLCFHLSLSPSTIRSPVVEVLGALELSWSINQSQKYVIAKGTRTIDRHRIKARTSAMTQRFETAEDWEKKWNEGVSPGEYWDKKCPSPILVNELTSNWLSPSSGIAIVPGCGRGYDVEVLARTGYFSKVIGMDIAPTAKRTADEYLASCDLKPGSYEIRCEDFFTAKFEEEVVFIYDYTFLCALPLDMRKKWADRMVELLKPGGFLLTLIFPMGKSLADGGPPFGVSFENFEELLEGKGFTAVDGPRLLADNMCHQGREGRCGYARWLRTS